MSHIIREYTHSDIDAVKKCLTDLQDFHHMIDPHRLTGIEVANEYLEKLLAKCEANKGKIFVVEENEGVVGMVAVIIEENKVNKSRLKRHALITDIIILPEYRGRGISKELIATAEEYARSKDVQVIQASILLYNSKALKVYTRNGFTEHEIILRKLL